MAEAAALAARGFRTPPAAPVIDQDFADRMADFAPFERSPRLAVAVSGGADSLALTVLADRWARAQGGGVLALTVDHRLRPDSTAEAAELATWLSGRGIDHQVLAWTGPKPAQAIQDAARTARRDLLLEECRRRGILHLLLGHHADDQTETLIMRAAAGSGRDGLAGMSAVVEEPDVRLLRPLLDIPRDRLAATLAAFGQGWIEDPSNRDRRFLRTVARDAAAAAPGAAATASSFGRERAHRDGDVAAVLAAAVAVYPEGWAEIEGARLSTAPPDIGRRALAQVLMCISGNPYPPRGERLERLYDAIAGRALGAGRTLAGCRILERRDVVLIARETAAIGPDIHIHGPGRYLWDHRFVLQVAAPETTAGFTLRGLGSSGWSAVAALDKSLRALPIPPVVRPSLPAIYDLEGVRQVPHLMYRRQGADPDSVRVVSASFRPRHVLAGAGFAVSPRSEGKIGR